MKTTRPRPRPQCLSSRQPAGLQGRKTDLAALREGKVSPGAEGGGGEAARTLRHQVQLSRLNRRAGSAHRPGHVGCLGKATSKVKAHRSAFSAQVPDGRRQLCRGSC